MNFSLRFLRSLFPARPPAAKPRRRRTPLTLEPLEDRCVPVATVQTFNAPDMGSHFVPGQFNNGPEPTVMDGGPTGTGKFLRLVSADPTPMPPSFNTIAFDRTNAGPSQKLVADFDFRITPGNGRADGFGFALLNTQTYGSTGPVGGTAEEPNFTGSLGVGFDIYRNADIGDIGPPNIRGNVFSNSISLHFNGAVLTQVDVTPVLDLARGIWTHTRILVQAGGGGADVSVLLSPAREQAPVTVIDRFHIAGYTPYEGRVHFGARAGGETAAFDLDNVNVRFLRPLQGTLSFSAAATSAAETGGAAQVTVTRTPAGVGPDVAPFAYGAADWIPVAGDWNGDGVATLGAFDPNTATWYLKNSNSPGAPDFKPFQYGAPGWIPVVGDWDGDGVTSIGVFDPATATFYLRNSNSPGAPDAGQFVYGVPGWVPVAGDWDGDGKTTVGAFDPTGQFGQPPATWYLRNSNSPGAPDAGRFTYGAPGWVPVTGDWDGDGQTTVGAFDPTGQFGQLPATWYLRNSNSAGPADAGMFAYGGAMWRPIPADWDGNGVSTVGVFDPTGQFGQAPATWYQRNRLPSAAVTVRFSATGLTATAGADFTPVSGMLTFAPGETTKSFSVPVLPDPAREGDLLVQVSLSNPTGGAELVGPSAAAVTIVDNETARSLGHWSDIQPLSILAIHMQLLPTGRVMFWDRLGNARLWDPVTQTVSIPALAGYDAFCSGHTFLADGRLLVTGGHPDEGDATQDGVGVKNATVYDPFANTWTPLPDMNAGRWYPTNTTLANGDVLVTSGSIDTVFNKNTLAQVWQPATGTWRNLTGAQAQAVNAAALGVDLYPRMFLAPDGRVFKAGPDKSTWFLDTTGTGSWTRGPDSNFGLRTYGAAVLYAPGKILIVGGGDVNNGATPNDDATATAEVIDLNAATPVWRTVAPLAFGRRHLNASLLADGKVLVTGGVGPAGFNNERNPVLPAEVWDPGSETWTTLPSAQVTRGYHSTALLLPDGRVVSSGGGEGAGATGVHNDAEIYSPSYLFAGTRPTIAAAPDAVGYGQSFTVGTPDAANVTAVNLIRLPSTTHAFDANQRFVSVPFSRTTGALTVTAPSNPNLAPPGHYLMFLLSNGVPSVAKIIRIG